MRYVRYEMCIGVEPYVLAGKQVYWETENMYRWGNASVEKENELNWVGK